MSGTSSNQNQQQQQSVSNPWGPTQGLLGSIVGRLGGQSTDTTPNQFGALQSLQSATSGIPNFGGLGATAVNNAFGTDTKPQQGLLSSALSTMQNNLGGTASGANLNPMSTPGFSDALKTMNSDISNQVNGQFAAAGRDMSPANSTALARGLSQGEGGLLANQFNQNFSNMMGANGQLLGAAGSTAGGLTQQQQAALQSQLSGIQAGGMLPGLYGAPGEAQLSAANQQYAQPFQNIGMLSSILNPIAGLGGQVSSTGSSSGSNTMSGAQQFGSIAGGLNTLWSDVRLKDDVEPVGKLNDGSNVYSYRYKGDPTGTTHIGLLAQEVERTRPDAVVEIGGMKAVDYKRATEKARAIGGLLSDRLAA